MNKQYKGARGTKGNPSACYKGMRGYVTGAQSAEPDHKEAKRVAAGKLTEVPNGTLKTKQFA